MNANYQGEVLSYRIIVLFSTGVKRGQWQQTHSIEEINLMYTEKKEEQVETIIYLHKINFFINFFSLTLFVIHKDDDKTDFINNDRYSYSVNER